MAERLIPLAQRAATSYPELTAYCDWALQQRGFTPATVRQSRWHLTYFLTWCAARGRCVANVAIGDIDSYIVAQSERGWCRRTMNSVAKILRMFFRFAAQQGFTRRDLSIAIQAPRIYAMEGLPAAIDWADVRRLFASINLRHARDVRALPMLMLVAIYGFRAGEVTTLRLEDLDWERRRLSVRRLKRRGTQEYPLLPSLSHALIRYLKEVRHQSHEHREIFLSLAPPFRPITVQTLYKMVSARLQRVGVSAPHWGPHCLRHSCAMRLVAEGLSLKEIGDHLGHRSTRSTRIYAKVDLAGLRDVAAFDLGELS